jgi:DnaJ domain
MPRIILLILLAGALWYGWQYIKSRPPAERRRLLWIVGIWSILIVSVLLVATGRMHWIGMAIAALIPLTQTLIKWLVRLAPIARLMGQRMKPSTITTRGLKATFNLGTGEASGEVLEGPFAGRQLNDLDGEQLKEQLAYFQSNDRQSAMLMQAYLLRRGMGDASSRQHQGAVDTGAMTNNEAWQVLGLEAGASREEIIKAHKRLIQKLHPDRGGNEYLAAKINAARDRLLDE